MDDELIPAGPVRPTGRPVGAPPPSQGSAPAGPLDEVEASPEEQSQLEQVVSRLGKFIWGEPEKVINAMNHGDQEVWQTVGTAAYNLVKGEFSKAQAAGVEMGADIGQEAAAEYVIPWLFELGEAAGVFPKMDERTEQEQMSMALIEAERLHGESLLSGPDAETHVQEAQDMMARGIAQEADAGQLDPEFVNAMNSIPGRTPMATGVARGMEDMSRGA